MSFFLQFGHHTSTYFKREQFLSANSFLDRLKRNRWLYLLKFWRGCQGGSTWTIESTSRRGPARPKSLVEAGAMPGLAKPVFYIVLKNIIL